MLFKIGLNLHKLKQHAVCHMLYLGNIMACSHLAAAGWQPHHETGLPDNIDYRSRLQLASLCLGRLCKSCSPSANPCRAHSISLGSEADLP